MTPERLAETRAELALLDSDFAAESDEDTIEMCRELLAEVERLRAERDELRAALKPFADYAGIVSEFADSSNPIGDTCPPRNLTERNQWRNAKPLPTLGDCRRAAELLARTEGQS